MAQYVDIMTDAGFKAVFQDKQVTIKFLNAALAGERQIKDITYLDKEIKPEIVENRTIIFDLLCEDVSGAKFILEMQNCPQYYFFNRGFYYLCRMVARQGRDRDSIPDGSPALILAPANSSKSGQSVILPPT